jgi:dTDP-glucose pyrophosphorylase
MDKLLNIEKSISFKNINYFDSTKYLEIIDLIKLVYKEKKLSIINFGRGVVWYDMGTFGNINKVSNLVKTLEERLGQQIGNVL